MLNFSLQVSDGTRKERREVKEVHISRDTVSAVEVSWGLPHIRAREN